MSPTQRSLALLRERGLLCRVVEVWNPWVHRKLDLWGFDILAVDPLTKRTIAVQTTTQANVAARRDKLRALETTPKLLLAGWDLWLHGWAKRGARGKRKTWSCKEERVYAVEGVTA